jgi:hypothetical protein
LGHKKKEVFVNKDLLSSLRVSHSSNPVYFSSGVAGHLIQDALKRNPLAYKQSGTNPQSSHAAASIAKSPRFTIQSPLMSYTASG